MRRTSILISIVCIVILITIFSGLLSRVQAAPTAPQWDYAALYYIDSGTNVIWAEVDSDEQKLIRDGFATFAESLNLDAIPAIYYLNIAGRFGWELILEQDDNTGTAYTFKRVHE